MSSPAARAQARQSSASSDRDREDEGAGSRELRRDLAQASKQAEEWRRKTLAAQEEVKKMSRVLAKELGEGVAVGEASHLPACVLCSFTPAHFLEFFLPLYLMLCVWLLLNMLCG